MRPSSRLPLRTTQQGVVYRRWKRRMRKIRSDVTSILLKRYMFREIQRIVRDNPRIQVPSIFWTWLRQTYYGDIALSLRRQVDRDFHAISLWQLLTDIAEHPEVLSRERYVSRASGLSRDLMNDEFDSFAVKHRRHISRTRILRDRHELEMAAKTVRKYVNKRVAHWDIRGPRRIPSIKDVDECIRVLENLTRKYATLILKEGGVLIPTFAYDWKKPFRVAWMPPSKSEPR